MTSVSRNSLCPCGSGLKYKKCCLGKSVLATHSVVEALEDYKRNQEVIMKASFDILKKYNYSDVFKVLSYLSVQPGNHGKNIRLENLVTELLREIKRNDSPTDFSKLLRDIKQVCTKHWAEDPPEEFFTENIIFDNDNHIVFPGISAGATEIVQGLIYAIQFRNELPEAFKRTVNEGLRLVFYLHDTIARNMGLTHRMFEEQLVPELQIPDEPMILEGMALFCWTNEAIAKISEELKIPCDTIDQFIFHNSTTALNFSDPNQNPLLQYPFIRLGNEVILLMPTAELTCVNDFIIRQARSFNCLEVLLKEYENHCKVELLSYIKLMDWRFEEFSFNTDGMSSAFLLDQSLWRIDTNKLVYLTMITENPDYTIDAKNRESISLVYYQKVESETASVKNLFPEHQILMVCIINKSRSLGVLGLSFKFFRNSDYQLFFGIQELEVLMRVWEFDRLTLWKYAKDLDIAEKKIRFAPLQTHYSKFKWYKRNEESFYDPDEEPFSSAVFGFEIESEVRRKGIVKMDKIGIIMPGVKEDFMVPCYRKDEYYPAYISQAVHYGYFHSCLLKYSCPIWFIPAGPNDIGAEIYINGFMYWLNEMYDTAKDFINQLGQRPVLFSVSMDEKFHTINNMFEPQEAETNMKYLINKGARTIDIKIPIGIIQFLSRPDNEGEQELMAFILDMLGLLIEATGSGIKLGGYERDRLIQSTVPLGIKKMMILATGDRDLCIAKVDVQKPRIIPKSDVSNILQNQVKWLGYKCPVPEKISDDKGKIKLFNDLAYLHYEKLRRLIQHYDGLPLLLFLMRRHEPLLQERSFRKVNYPAREACFGKYYNVYDEFSETERHLTLSSLAMRVLIEFVACKLPTGKKQANDDDIDYMLATTSEIIQYGSLSDEIKYKIRQMDVGLLPSGRIGVNLKEGNAEFQEFTEKLYGEEYDSYTKDFKNAFYRNTEADNQKVKPDEYFEYTNTVFRQVWGIGLYDIPVVSHWIAHYLFEKNKSVETFIEGDFVNLLRSEGGFSETEISSYINQLSFLERQDILLPPLGYKKEDTYPWRYNRPISYLSKPVIRLKIENDYMIIISVRHLWGATENLVSGFGMATLKVDKNQKELQQLLARQNAIKGKEYRNEVFNWLRSNCPFLRVMDYEVKISPRGFFKAAEDKGDIDILAIDDTEKVIYSIECKNTHQSKVAYDFRREIDNYLGNDKSPGMINKHVKRDIWLRENIKYVTGKLKVGSDYSIVSLVVTRHILPAVSTQVREMPVVSFYELTKFGLKKYTKEDRLYS